MEHIALLADEVPEAEIVDALMVELADWEKNNAHRIPVTKDAEGLGRRKLPTVAV